MATALGATLLAFAAQPHDEENPINSQERRTVRSHLVTALSRAGADKVVMMPVPEHSGPAMWAHDGMPLHLVCERVKPRAVLLAATHSGRDIAPRLAARIGASYVAEPSVEYGPQGQVILAKMIHGAQFVCRISLEDVPQCAVVTLASGSYRVAEGNPEAATMSIELPEPVIEVSSDRADGRFDALHQPGIEYLDSAADAGADLNDASIIVVGGGGVQDAAEYELLGKLAEVLGGQLAATAALSARGLAPPERVIGVGRRRVNPELYFACGASGSSEHLDAVSRDACIVAINSDADAPIFKVASYGIVGEVGTVVADLIEALSQVSESAS